MVTVIVGSEHIHKTHTCTNIPILRLRIWFCDKRYPHVYYMYLYMLIYMVTVIVG